MHLTSGMAFYGSHSLSGSGKINTFSKTRWQLPGVPTAAERVGDGPAGGRCCSPGGAGKYAKGSPTPPRADSRADLECDSATDLLSLGAAVSSPVFWLTLMFKGQCVCKCLVWYLVPRGFMKLGFLCLARGGTAMLGHRLWAARWLRGRGLLIGAGEDDVI